LLRVVHGFASHDATGELVFAAGAEKRIINMDKTCISLDRSNGNANSAGESQNSL
jgi:hypothetical protein